MSTISADAGLMFEADPVILEVTAENLGDERVEWGRGSSSCQSGRAVRLRGRCQREVWPESFYDPLRDNLRFQALLDKYEPTSEAP